MCIRNVRIFIVLIIIFLKKSLEHFHRKLNLHFFFIHTLIYENNKTLYVTCNKLQQLPSFLIFFEGKKKASVCFLLAQNLADVNFFFLVVILVCFYSHLASFRRSRPAEKKKVIFSSLHYCS